MRFAMLLLSALVVLSDQQLQHPRGLIWASPYSQYRQAIYYGSNENVDSRTLRRHYRPQSMPVSYLQNQELTTDNQDNIGELEETEGRIKGVDHGGRFLYSTTINNPFYKTATFTITSTVTTLGSIIICVPANNLVAVPSPTCAGRKKRELEENNQFPIVPSQTLSVMPTAVPSTDTSVVRETRQSSTTSDQHNSRALLSSKEEFISSFQSSLVDDKNDNLREKRFFGGGGVAALTTLTSYSFVGATITSTVLLDPTGANLAACLPAGYVVC